MTKAMATSWNGGTSPVSVVNKAKVAHITIAVPPIRLARMVRRWAAVSDMADFCGERAGRS